MVSGGFAAAGFDFGVTFGMGCGKGDFLAGLGAGSDALVGFGGAGRAFVGLGGSRAGLDALGGPGDVALDAVAALGGVEVMGAVSALEGLEGTVFCFLVSSLMELSLDATDDRRKTRLILSLNAMMIDIDRFAPQREGGGRRSGAEDKRRALVSADDLYAGDQAGSIDLEVF